MGTNSENIELAGLCASVENVLKWRIIYWLTVLLHGMSGLLSSNGGICHGSAQEISIVLCYGGYQVSSRMLKRVDGKSVFSVLWSLWLQRNLIVFQGKLVDNRQTRVAFWSKANFDLKMYSVEDFKRCLQGIRKVKATKIVLKD